MPVKGVCRICGCTELKPCQMVPNPDAPLAGQPKVTCAWADKTQTLCTNPRCLEKAKRK
jgi:hypothetical protein